MWQSEDLLVDILKFYDVPVKHCHKLPFYPCIVLTLSLSYHHICPDQWVPPSFENEIIFQHLMIKDKFFVSDKNICSVAYWLPMLDQNSLRNTKHWLGDPTPAAVMFVDIRILDPLQWSCCCCFWWWWWRCWWGWGAGTRTTRAARWHVGDIWQCCTILLEGFPS